MERTWQLDQVASPSTQKHGAMLLGSQVIPLPIIPAPNTKTSSLGVLVFPPTSLPSLLYNLINVVAWKSGAHRMHESCFTVTATKPPGCP
jgi:hypothetical protein